MGLYEFNPEDAKRFAREQGIKFVTRGNELQFRHCPYCGNKTDDKNTFAINLTTGQFKCLRATCGAHGNMITLSRDFDFSLGTDADEYYQPKRRYRNLTKAPLPVTRPAAISYLEGRGISAAIAEMYHITTQKDAENVLVFPFIDDKNELQFVKYRKTDFDKAKDKNKEWCEANCKPILFGMDRCLLDGSPLVLTEGQIDSLSVAEAGIKNAVSVPTGAKGMTWVPYCWDFLCKFDKLIVFGDHENDQITLLEDMRKRFPGSVWHVRPEDYLDCKDANELLQKHGKEAVRNAINKAVPVEDPSIVRLSEVKRKRFEDLERFDTGIAELDKKTGGMIMGQLVILTGKRGSGKSTLASQLGTFAIKSGYTIFYYSGELNDWQVQEWFERQIAGPANIRTERSNFGYESFSVKDAFIDRIRNWYGDKAFLFQNSADNDDKILETTTNAVKQYGARVLILDNLMSAMNDDLSFDIYRQQTVFVKKLAKMAKEYDVCIILVVHPRKSNGEFKNDDVSGSSNITNLADVVLNYSQPDKTETEYDAYLQITKNRYGGILDMNPGIGLFFDRKSKRIYEGRPDWSLGWNAVKEPEPADDLPDEIPF